MRNHLRKWKKYRNYITICLVLFLICSFGDTVQAAAKYGISSGGKGNWAYHVLSEKKKTVEIRPDDLCNVKGKKTLKIPNTIKGQDGKTTYKVTKIANHAFANCVCTSCVDYKSLEKRWNKSSWENSDCECYFNKVIIPENVTEIGESAFDWGVCEDDELQTVVFKGENVKVIGDGAFYASDITSISIPKNVTTIGDLAFGECDSLKSVNFNGDNITSIGEAAFRCTNLESIVIPAKIKKVEDYTFCGCEYLSTVTFKGNNVVEIGEGAFSESGLSNIIIPSKCKSIGESAFSDCDKLKSVTFLQTGSMSVDKLAFSGSPIEKVNIQNYTVYECLIERFDYPDYVKVDSKSTRLFLEYNGQTAWLDVPNGQTVNLSSYFKLPEGMRACGSGYGYGIDMVPDDDVYVSGYRRGFSESTIDYEMTTYTAQGYPHADISLYLQEIYYGLSYEEDLKHISNINWHNSCEYGVRCLCCCGYILCYWDQFILSDLSEGDAKAKQGYKPVGYEIDGKKYAPGATISGKILGIKNWKRVDITVDYQPIQYQIAYNFNGGSGTGLANTVCTYDKETLLQQNTSYNGGYKFVGWCENPNGEGIIYKHGDKVKNLTAKDGEVVTLYAVWKDEAVLVTFDANGGTVGQGSKKVRYNQQFGNLPTPKREGYKFKGWTMGPNGGTKVTSASVVSYNCDFSLFAQWEAKSYTVTFNANGGEGGGNKEVKYGKSLGNLPKATRKGYKFKGWYTSKNGGDKITATTKVTGRKTYYAHWEEKGKTLTITVKPKNIKKLSGYQVKYGKKGGKMTTKTYQSGTKKSIQVKITGVKKGETYIAKARSYRVVKGKKKWSKWKTVTKTVE